MPPEWPRCLIDPLFSPRNFFWGVVGLQPLRLGLQPLRQSRHGLQSSLIRHGLPSPRIRHGCPSSPLRHGSRNGRYPGGLLSCLRVPGGLQSAHPPSPLDGVPHRSGGWSNVRSVFPMSCVSLPLVTIFGLPVPVHSQFN